MINDSKILIEKYRGFDITFNRYNEKFECVCTNEEEDKKSSSYSAIKKHIDDFYKNNQKFEPFCIIQSPSYYRFHFERLRVIGIRKDGKIVVEKENGDKANLSEYEYENYNLENEEEIANYEKLHELHKELESYKKNCEIERKRIIEGMTFESLKTWRDKFSGKV